MKIYTPKNSVNNFEGPGLFLAGPTPRSVAVPSWRLEAIKYLNLLGYAGVLFIPEPFAADYDKQIAWEEAALTAAKVICFWIPRNLDNMPGFTTNIEFGTWMQSGKVVLGAPKDAPKMSYLRYYAKKYQMPQADSLQQTLAIALKMMETT